MSFSLLLLLANRYKFHLAGAGVLAMLLRSRPPLGRVSEEDVEYLARMLVLERGNIDPDAEWAAIAWVAVNRAIKSQSPIRSAVAAISWPGGGERGRSFVQAVLKNTPGRTALGHHSASVGHPRIDLARGLSRKILSGQVRNVIGERTHFVHPGPFRACNTEGRVDGKFVCFRSKRLPRWIVDRGHGGTAEFEPVVVKTAMFAELGE